jgi:hypothetical protein
MTTTRITISGPGGCINNEVVLLTDLLNYLGYDVEVNNPYPDDKPRTPAQLAEEIKKLNSSKPWKIVINADHVPWGG